MRTNCALRTVGTLMENKLKRSDRRITRLIVELTADVVRIFLSNGTKGLGWSCAWYGRVTAVVAQKV